jgi:hypothetical protein
MKIAIIGEMRFCASAGRCEVDSGKSALRDVKKIIRKECQRKE